MAAPIPYPNSHSGLDDKGITSVGKYTRRMLDTTFWRKPNWMVLQGFAWASLRHGAPFSSYIYPTDTQMRFMAYDAMLNGATGYVLWGTHHIESSAFYHTIQKATRELHAMSGLYVADCQGEDIATANPDVRVVPFTYTKPSSVSGLNFWPFSNKPAHYFAVMNMVDKDSTVTFATGLDTKKYTNYETKEFIVADNGNVTLTLKPYEVAFFGDAPLPKPAYELPKVRPELEKITDPIGKILAEQQELIANAEFYKGKANWIWNDVNKHIPSCRTLVTKSFDVNGAEQKAMLSVAADDSSEVFLNGKSIGKTAGWNLLVKFDLTGKLQLGKNTVTILAEDAGRLPCGVLAELAMDDKVVSVTDASWLAKPLEYKQKYDPKDTDDFKPAFILTPYGGGAWGSNVLIKK